MRRVLPCMLVAALVGCAGSFHHREGAAELAARNYPEAVRLLLLEVAQHPENWEAWRDLGVAQYKTRDLDAAAASLERTIAHRPQDGQALFFLGSTYEEQGDLDRALATYGSYVNVRRFSSFRGVLRDRQRFLIRQQLRAEAARLAAREDSLDVADIPERSITVLPLSMIGEERRYAPLGAALAEWITVDLAKIRDLHVVERLRLNAVLDELDLARRGVLQEGESLRLGQLLGANHVVGGTLQESSPERLLVQTGVTSVRRDVASIGPEAVGEANDFFALQKQLVFELLIDLGITPTARERAEIDQPRRHELTAILAFGEGLMAEQRGALQEARTHYEKALEIDSTMDIAARAFESIPSTTTVPDVPVLPDPAAMHDDALGQRLEETERLTSGAFWPSTPNDVPPLPPTVVTIPPPPPPPPDPGSRDDAPSRLDPAHAPRPLRIGPTCGGPRHAPDAVRALVVGRARCSKQPRG